MSIAALVTAEPSTARSKPIDHSADATRTRREWHRVGMEVSDRIAWGKNEGARRVAPSELQMGLGVNRGVLGDRLQVVSWNVTVDPQGRDDDAVDAGSVAGGIWVGEHDGIRAAVQLYG